MIKRLSAVALIVVIAGGLLWLSERPTHATTSTLTGTIVDAQGNAIKGTILTMQLPVPAQDTATNTAITNSPVQYRLVNGVIQSGPPLYDVNGLQPLNLYYTAKVYDSAGNYVATLGNYVVTGASFNLGAAVPTSITTSNVSFITPVSATANNTLTGNNNFTGLTTLALPVNLTQSGFTNSLAGTVTGTRTWTLQDASDTFVYRATVDTLTNKTLTTPTVTTPVINGASTGTGVQGTDTKLFTSGTVSGTSVLLCTDANGGATTSGCPNPNGVTEFTWSNGTLPTANSQPLNGNACQTALSFYCSETVFAKAHTLVRITFIVTTGNSGCSPNVSVGVFDITGAAVVSQVAVNAAANTFVDSGPLSVATTAGHNFTLGVTTAGAGCGTFPSITGLTAVFQ